MAFRVLRQKTSLGAVRTSKPSLSPNTHGGRIYGTVEGLLPYTPNMNRAFQPFRTVAVALLAMSTSVAPICTPVSAQSYESNKAVEAKPSRTVCCCGTADGKCCGTACCMRRPSKQVPTDPPYHRKSVEKDGSQVLALVLATCGDALTDGGGFGRPFCADFCGSLAAATLQSQHVRIQT